MTPKQKELLVQICNGLSYGTTFVALFVYCMFDDIILTLALIGCTFALHGCSCALTFKASLFFKIESLAGVLATMFLVLPPILHKTFVWSNRAKFIVTFFFSLAWCCSCHTILLGISSKLIDKLFHRSG